ncbi:unnamed protein product [Dibothriocephalus latus]|uniref:Uncharacterized protein n=1 Tax=Dibothriocephalus latus TaxID=60516 RepID=A0A3P7MZH8_DIBLA|nr:unnamed protein product [Dibothriocephalus latus]
MLKPAYTWGPALDDHRNKFLSQIRLREQRKKKQQEVETSESKLSTSQLSVTGRKLNSDAHLQTTCSCPALSAAKADEPSFFQSKLNIAEKMTTAHAKDLMKRGEPGTASPSEDLTVGVSDAANTVSSTTSNNL